MVPVVPRRKNGAVNSMVGSTVSKMVFIKRYGCYLAAQVFPTWAREPNWVVRHRFRYRIFWIDPTRVTAKPGFLERDRPQRALEIELLDAMTRRFVVDGEWDLHQRQFDLHPTIREIFVDGRAATESHAYADMIAAVSQSDFVRARGCRNRTEVDRWFMELYRIYDDMRTHGYRTQLQLRRPPVDEINICIGRDGQPLLIRHGNHRLSMAKVLGLTCVPVVVRGVHPRWVYRVRHNHRMQATSAAVARGVRGISGLPCTS